jgi:hypothetical protein
MRLENSPVEVEAAQPNTESRAKPARARVREAGFQDYAQIAALESRYGLQPKSYEEWAHLWIENPVYRQLPQWPIGWVCENERAEVVGCIANIPLAYEFENQTLIAATSRALVVASPYRPYCFPLLSCFFGQKNVDLFLNTTVNSKALKLHEIFRTLRVPTGIWDRSAFWITNYPAFAASLLAMKELPGSPALRYPLSAGLLLKDAVAGRGLRMRGNKSAAEFCTRFDERFDRFWKRLRKSSSGRLLASRARDVLEWHFKHALATDKAWVLTVASGSELSAYAIFRRQDNPAYGLKRMRLVDFQTMPGEAELLGPMLLCALDRCRREGIHMLEAIGFCSDKQRVIESLAPHRRQLSSWRYFYKANNEHLAASLQNSQVWDATCFDGDASL